MREELAATEGRATKPTTASGQAAAWRGPLSARLRRRLGVAAVAARPALVFVVWVGWTLAHALAWWVVVPGFVLAARGEAAARRRLGVAAVAASPAVERVVWAGWTAAHALMWSVVVPGLVRAARGGDAAARRLRMAGLGSRRAALAAPSAGRRWARALLGRAILRPLALARRTLLALRSSIASAARSALGAGRRCVLAVTSRLVLLVRAASGRASPKAALGNVAGRFRPQTGAIRPPAGPHGRRPAPAVAKRRSGISLARRKRADTAASARPGRKATRRPAFGSASPHPAVTALLQPNVTAAPTSPAELSSPVRLAVPSPWTWEECEIDRHRRYVRSAFLATALRPSGERYVADRSPSFRSWRSRLPSDKGPGAQAHAQLLEWLVADGWEPVGTGPQWFRTRLRRRMRPTLRELAEKL